MSLSFLYDTVLFDSPSRVFLQQHAGLVPSGVVTEIHPFGTAGHIAPLFSATDLSITSLPNYLTWTFVYPHTVTADTMALIGLNFDGAVGLVVDGSGVTFDQGLAPTLPDDKPVGGQNNNKWLTFSSTAGSTWMLTIAAPSILGADSILAFSSILAGVRYTPDRSYTQFPQVQYRRAGARSHQGVFTVPAQWPIFRRVRMNFAFIDGAQRRRFREIFAIGSVRFPIVVNLNTREDADFNTMLCQVGNNMGMSPYVEINNATMELDEVAGEIVEG